MMGTAWRSASGKFQVHRQISKRPLGSRGRCGLKPVAAAPSLSLPKADVAGGPSFSLPSLPKFDARTAPDDSLANGVRQLQASKELANSVPSAPLSPPVPGTEILPTQPPEGLLPPSQGMDFVLKQLNDSATPPATKTPSAVGIALDDAADSLAGATKSVTQGAAAATSQAADAAGAVGDAVGEGVSSAAAAASAAAAGVADQLGSVAASAAQLYQQARQEAGSVVANVQDNISSLVSGAQASAEDAVSAVTSQVETQYSAFVDLLPPGAKDTLAAAAAAAGAAADTAFAAIQAATADPVTGAAALGVAVGVPAILAWQAAYGGFAGTLSPDKVISMLQSQDVLLVDVRPETKRLEAGVPELKRGARGKGIALPPVQLLPSVARRVRSADDLALQILGAEVAALARAGPSTELIIMDERGERGKVLARAATAAGVRRVFVVDGGFRAWKAAGLNVAENVAEYDNSPLAAVGDAAETVAKEAAGLVSEPAKAALAVGGVAAAALVVLNYHTVLRVIGLLGLEATVALRVLQYESPQNALDDLNSARAWLSNAVNLPVRAAQGVAGLVQRAQQDQPAASQREAQSQ